MTQLIDRLNRELETFGRKAHAAFDEGKLQLELLRLRRQQDTAARDLGLLTHRRERGGQVDVRRVDSLLFRLDDLEARIGQLETEIAGRRRARRERATASEVPEADGVEQQPAGGEAAGTI
ncbi:MAG TPA: hypothetical protein VFW66_04405 [Gemmatimonadales bacterium]|nr:hypothetical protein [Gemmatimonadales bacterium]